jgi:diaminopimelate decarboxylase
MLAAHGFRWTPDGLTCDGLPVSGIASEVGTPFYLYSAGVVRSRLQALDRAVGGAPHAIHYALKANSTLALLRVIRAAGAGADVNSGGEMDVALRAGFIPSDIIFTGVGKRRDELERAVALGVKAVNVESAGELERLDAIARHQGVRARVALRVNPDIDPETHRHISTGLKHNKFGVPLDAAAGICRTYATRAGLDLAGLHAHIGSQITSVEPLRRAAEVLVELARELRAVGIRIDHLDVGGGLGIAYEGGAEPDVAAYGAAMTAVIAGTDTTLLLEPGRWLVAPAGVLVAGVVDTKPAPEGRRFVVLDAGMTDFIRPALYDAFHRIAMVSPRPGLPDVTCDVVGPVCESSDTFGCDRSLTDPRVGDLVVIFDTGAYGSVMASNYNRRTLPAEVLVDEGAWRVIRRRQTIEEQLACED